MADIARIIVARQHFVCVKKKNKNYNTRRTIDVRNWCVEGDNNKSKQSVVRRATAARARASDKSRPGVILSLLDFTSRRGPCPGGVTYQLSRGRAADINFVYCRTRCPAPPRPGTPPRGDPVCAARRAGQPPPPGSPCAPPTRAPPTGPNIHRHPSSRRLPVWPRGVFFFLFFSRETTTSNRRRTFIPKRTYIVYIYIECTFV